MKKVIAVLMALAVCGTVAYTACAEEVANDEDVLAVAPVEENKEESILDKLANDEKAQNLAGEIKSALANNGDVKAVYEKIANYVGNLDKAGSGRDALDKFLEDAGVNTEVLNDAISKSVVANAALDLYYKPTPEEPTTEEEEPTTEEEVSIPDTGYQF